jgi:predicted dehydrogenase
MNGRDITADVRRDIAAIGRHLRLPPCFTGALQRRVYPVYVKERDRSPIQPRAKLLGAHHGSTFFEHLAFRDAIRSGGRPLVSAADGALAVAVGVAGERSAKERRPVELRELGF